MRYDTMPAEGRRKQNIISLGEFTRKFGLKEARVEAHERKNFAKDQNTNLARVRKEEKMDKARIKKMPTFQELAKSWLDLRTAEWEERSAKQNRGRLAANIYPVIGHMPVNTITVADVERALKFVIERGALEVAHRVHTLVVCIFKIN